MDLATPWTPILNGKALPPCTVYNRMVKAGDLPNSMQDPTWIRRALDPFVANVPEGADALWECVLALWRLKLMEEAGSDDEVWRQHVSAWLHRHRDLCRYLKIKPLRVIVRFANAMRTAQNLPEDMIPSLEPESIPKPKASLPATSRSSARRPPPVTDGDGAEMADEGRLLRGGPSRSGDNGPTSAAEPQRENSDLVKVGSKRKVQESLSQAQASSKRVRVTRKTAAIEGGKDLSEHTFPEDSEVSAELVPQVEGKVCNRCRQKNFPCRPIWHKNKSFITVRCAPCMISKQGCSFKDVNWEIAEWPTLTATKAALERRAKEAAAKRKGTSSSTKSKGVNKPPAGAQTEASAALDSVALESVSQVTPLSSTEPHPQAQGDSALTQPSASSSERAPAPLTEIPSLPAQTLAGKNHSVFMENLLPYQDILSDPKRTPLSLKLQVIELDAICSRERREAQFLMDMIKGRASVIDTMISSIEDEASRLENSESEDDSGSHRDADEDEGGVDGEEEEVERVVQPSASRSRRR